MREIKFNFVYGVDGEVETYLTKTFDFGEIENQSHWYFILDSPLMKGYSILAKRQYTGLKDKNGTDIYESDIVLAHDSWGKYSGVIEWWNDRWVLRFPGSDGTPQNQSLMTVRKPKVIGNIYETPDILSEPVSNSYKLD